MTLYQIPTHRASLGAGNPVRTMKLKSLLALVSALIPLSAATAGQQPVQLRCDYQSQPLAIESAKPRLSWVLKDTRPGARQTAYRLLVASQAELLQEGKADLWDSGQVQSDQSIHVVYAGKPLVTGQRAFWTVRTWDAQGVASPYAPAAFWEMGILTPADWKAQMIRMKTEPEFTNDAVAHWIEYGIGRKATEGDRTVIEKEMKPAPYFRSEFSLEAVPKLARLAIASLGYYELHINGNRVGNRVMDPNYQDYERRMYYVVHDVAPYLKPGRNAIGVYLGNTWYYQAAQTFGKSADQFSTYKEFMGNQGVVVQLDAEVGGKTVRVVSDANWKVSYGPLLRNQLFVGEVYDARREMPGWDLPGFDDKGWMPVEAVPAPVERLEAMQVVPERVIREVKAVKITEPSPGIYVVDLGETIAGWPKLTVNEPAGTKIAVRPAAFIRNRPEYMTPYKLPYPDPKLDEKSIENMIAGELHARMPGAEKKGRSEFHACDVYVTSGKGAETFQRRFSYTGFRYFEINGLSRKPTLDQVSGVQVHSDLPKTGRFACSDEKVNELYASFCKTIRYVSHGLVNDNSDAEKNSFRGHQAMAGDFLAYAWNDPQFWEKAVDDIQVQTGQELPDQPPTKAPAPRYFSTGRNAPLVASIDTIYEATRGFLFDGNRQLAERHFDYMLRFVNLYADRLVEPRHLSHFDRKNDKIGVLLQGDWLDVWKHGKRPQMGDGASSNGDTVYRCLFVIGLNRLIPTAKALGRTKEAAELAALRERVAATINLLAYNSQKKSYGSQAENVLALHAGVVPKADIPAVAADLKRIIMEEWQGHLSTGFVANRYICSVLTDFGHPEVAQHLWNVNTWPSWRWLYEQGYDTSNSYWNDFNTPAELPKARFIQSEKPVAVVWCYESLCGIKPSYEQPGFKHFVLAPVPPKTMQWAEAELQTAHGAIKSRWQREGDAVSYQFRVPANTTATMRLLCQGEPPAQIPGLRLVGTETGTAGRVAVYEAVPGTYSLTLR